MATRRFPERDRSPVAAVLAASPRRFCRPRLDHPDPLRAGTARAPSLITGTATRGPSRLPARIKFLQKATKKTKTQILLGKTIYLAGECLFVRNSFLSVSI